MSQLEITDLVKEYSTGTGDSVVAVENLDLSLDEGEFLVLVGPSGCGKSTTLRCVAGLESITDGSIHIGGRDVSDRTPEGRNIAMVFQNYALYPHMTARENMEFGLKMTTDLTKEERRKRVEDTAEMMGIMELLADKPKSLSGGQQQRVALGRAIVREPDVFLMDEPLSNLDAKLRTQMRTEIQQLQAELGVTTIYVTHDQTEAMTMGDRIAVLNDGELQQVGTPLECYYEPNNLFVADFIGEPSMNFFRLAVADDHLSGETITYHLNDDTREQITGYENVTLGIRPEDIDLVDEEQQNAFTATVEVVEPMGDENILHLNLGGDEVVAAVDGSYEIESGSKTRISFPSEKIHLFDSATGKTILNCQRHSKQLPTLSTTEGEPA